MRPPIKSLKGSALPRRGWYLAACYSNGFDVAELRQVHLFSSFEKADEDGEYYKATVSEAESAESLLTLEEVNASTCVPCCHSAANVYLWDERRVS